MNPPACLCVDGNNIIVNFTLMINNNLERSWFHDAIVGKVLIVWVKLIFRFLIMTVEKYKLYDFQKSIRINSLERNAK